MLDINLITKVYKKVDIMLLRKSFGTFNFILRKSKIINDTRLFSKSQPLSRTPCSSKNRLNLKNRYNFSAVSIKDMKITYDPSKKTEIISLNQECKHIDISRTLTISNHCILHDFNIFPRKKWPSKILRISKLRTQWSPIQLSWINQSPHVFT